MKNKFVSVQVKVNDYFDIDVDMEDVLKNIDVNDALQIAQKFRFVSSMKTINSPYDLTGENLYRFLCDVCQVSYHTPKNELINKLREKF